MERETSRLAFHVQSWDSDTEAAVRSLRNSRHIKIMDLGGGEYRQDIVQGIISEYRKNNPEATVGYRHYNEATDQRKGEENLSRHQQFTVDAIEAIHDHNMEYLVDIVYTPYNEVFPYDVGNFYMYVDALCSMGEQIRKSGFESAGGNWSVTTPHPVEVWEKIIPALEYLDYVVLHGYSKPTLLENEKELYPHESVIGWMRDNEIKPPSFILGEFGVDHALYTSPPNFKGWRHSLSGDEYSEQLKVSNNRLATSKYLYVACVFGAGAKEPWGSYGYSDDWRVIRAIDSIPDVANATAYTIEGLKNSSKLQDNLALGHDRKWLPIGLIKGFTEWRNTDGNQWATNTRDEAWAFSDHAASLGMPSNLIVGMGVSIESIYGKRVNREALMKMSVDLAVNEEEVPHPSQVMHMTPQDAGVMPAITIEIASVITGVDLDNLGAFLMVESGGEYVDGMGYPTCRFEVAQWAKRNPDGWKEASRYFDGEESWDGGDDIVNISGSWEKIHQGQQFRRSVIAFASTFGDRNQAYACSSWGAAQIMGWHYEVLGYSTAMEMSQAFVCPDRQMLAFITILGYLGCSSALAAGDIRGAIKMYNGSGQVNEYLKRFYKALDKIKGEKL